VNEEYLFHTLPLILKAILLIFQDFSGLQITGSEPANLSKIKIYWKDIRVILRTKADTESLSIRMTKTKAAPGNLAATSTLW
jgi:hypothetical protein